MLEFRTFKISSSRTEKMGNLAIRGEYTIGGLNSRTRSIKQPFRYLGPVVQKKGG